MTPWLLVGGVLGAVVLVLLGAAWLLTREARRAGRAEGDRERAQAEGKHLADYAAEREAIRKKYDRLRATADVGDPVDFLRSVVGTPDGDAVSRPPEARRASPDRPAPGRERPRE